MTKPSNQRSGSVRVKPRADSWVVDWQLPGPPEAATVDRGPVGHAADEQVDAPLVAWSPDGWRRAVAGNDRISEHHD